MGAGQSRVHILNFKQETERVNLMMLVFGLSKPSPVIYLFQSGLPRRHNQLETKYASVARDYLRHLSQTTVMLSTLLLTNCSTRSHFIFFRLRFLRLLHVREQKRLVNPSSHPSSIYERAGKFPGQGESQLKVGKSNFADLFWLQQIG